MTNTDNQRVSVKFYECSIDRISPFASGNICARYMTALMLNVFSSVSDHILCYSLLAFFSVCLDSDVNNVGKYMLIRNVL